MADVDVTNKNFQIPGVNSTTNYVQQRAYDLDFGANSEIAGVGTHKYIQLPDGEAVVGIKVIALKSAVSSGAATLQIKVNGSAVNSTAWTLAALAEGYTHNLNVAGMAAYGASVIQLTVGSAAFTDGKFLVIVETIPAKAFVTNG